MNDSEFAYRRQFGPAKAYPSVLAYRNPNPTGLLVIAGPCSVESPEQIASIVPVLKKCGVTYARGGVYRAGTYPGEVFGLQAELADWWSNRCHEAGLSVVMEVLDLRQAEWMAERADALQVGTRHMQDYALLKELSRMRRRVFLKRGVGSKLDEWLGAAEYLVRDGIEVVLVERGISTFNDHCRWTLDISSVPAVKTMTQIPVIVDASHGTGRRDLVLPMTLAGIAAGADGYIVEVHPDPDQSLSDSDQAYPLDKFVEFNRKVEAVWEAR